MSSEPGWPLALERAAASRIALVLGDTDSGKTTLTAYLAGALAGRGFHVGVVDADVGQSEIGPPTAIALGRVTRPIAALDEAERLALAWVGSTSPPGVEEALAAGVRRLAERGEALGLRPVLVDTCGLVRGALGRAVALGAIRQLEPDLVICLQRTDECAPILRELAAAPGVEVVALPVAAAARRRSPEARRRHRERALEAYFSGAVVRAVPLAWIEPGAPGDRAGGAALEDALVGLLDRDGETLGIGRIVAVEAGEDRADIETPVRGEVARVLLGRATFQSAALTR